jgi:histidine triad (HIT) family protein
MTLFEKIAAREIPANIAYEDSEIIAIHDINPQAPVHVLVIPKLCIARIGEATSDDAALLGRLLLASREIAGQLGVSESGYRLVINHGPDAGESVPHLHVHLLAGRPLAWPPG